MADNEKILKLLKVRYQKFFEAINIDKNTGCLKNNSTIKFATYPYIGSKYGQSEKILIIGLDMGKDETLEEIQSFEDRRKAIEYKPVSEQQKHSHEMGRDFYYESGRRNAESPCI